MSKFYRKKPIRERFNSKWMPEPFSGCHIWTGTYMGEFKRNYGQFWRNGRNVLAHRLSWGLHYGVIPKGVEVMHKCDTPACVNPAHLDIGTHIANMQGGVSRARFRRGERHPNAKLTSKAVAEILASPEHNEVLAARFGVTRQAIHSIKTRNGWRHVGGFIDSLQLQS